jgi:dihydrofolate reductase
VWGGVSFLGSLMRLDLIDEFRLDLHPYVVAGDCTRLFDDVARSYRLDLVSPVTTTYASATRRARPSRTRSSTRRTESRMTGIRLPDAGSG